MTLDVCLCVCHQIIIKTEFELCDCCLARKESFLSLFCYRLSALLHYEIIFFCFFCYCCYFESGETWIGHSIVYCVI